MPFANLVDTCVPIALPLDSRWIPLHKGKALLNYRNWVTISRQTSASITNSANALSIQMAVSKLVDGRLICSGDRGSKETSHERFQKGFFNKKRREHCTTQHNYLVQQDELRQRKIHPGDSSILVIEWLQTKSNNYRDHILWDYYRADPQRSNESS